mgnify:CR=1 FL=1
MIDLDTESVGLNGICVLIQYSIDEGPIILHEVFNEPVKDTLLLIERICQDDVCGFNLTHDWYHLTKLYNYLSSYENKSIHPTGDRVFTKNRGTILLKPRSALDLFLHARKGPYQSLMERDDIKIKRVPITMAPILCQYLKENFKLPSIYFANATNPEDAAEWKTEVIESDPKFCNIILKFRPSMKLKMLISEIFKIKVMDYPVPKNLLPEETNYNPYEETWIPFAQAHIDFWHSNKTARSYAEQDVVHLQRLRHTWGEPNFSDDDSELACHVGACRYLGFGLDIDRVRQKYLETFEFIKEFSSRGINFNSHQQVKQHLRDLANPFEFPLVKDTTEDTLKVLSEFNSKLGYQCGEILRFREKTKENDVLFKLLTTDRFCPNFKIIGAKSGRMSGGDFDDAGGGSLNPQGIQKQKEFRSLFTLADEGEELSGGDFKSFEVTLADAVYNDPKLHQDLVDGKSIHAKFGEFLYDKSYDEVIASQGTINNMYNPAKNSFFATLYGAMAHRISKTADVTEKKAELAYSQFVDSYPKIKRSRQMIFDAFCSMRQRDGIGTEITWREPAEYVETLLGFRRYFTIENKIVKLLFNLAQRPPKEFEVLGRCYRRDKEQTVKGATQSALYATAFQIQARNMRAAANHIIQGTGAQICKKLQRNIIAANPIGQTDLPTKTLNVHDEVLCVHPRCNREWINNVVKETIEHFRKTVPLLAIDWKNNLNNWGEK